jgi:hypothetical protein
MKINQNTILNFIGVFLIVLGLIRIFQLLFFGVPVHIFWLCNHVIVIMGIAILMRKSSLLIGEFSFLFVGQLVWIIGFLMYFIFGVTLQGSSAYLIYDRAFVNWVSILVHFLTLPLGLWAIIILGKKSKFAWVWGLGHALVLLPFVIYFGNKYNLNCFFEPCISAIPNSAVYPFLVISLYFVLFVIPINFLVNWVVGRIRTN